ncbi:MAG: phosphatidylserine decarboxylase [Chlamydiales bacterium]|nr:phosphatidylserine decarboxylase [Chlamydiales bacterium]
MIYDRKKGELFEEQVYGKAALRLLYAQNPISAFLRAILTKNAFASKIWGGWQNLPWTRFKVAPFIKKYGIDTSEFASPHFSSFNAFFTRKLKKEARPIQGEICTPADGRYLVYPNISKADGFVVKGQKFSLAKLVQDEALAKEYEEGGLLIARLAPVDYHRFHFPINCTAGEPHLINGALHSVNPLSIRQNVKRFTENKRVITKLETTLGPLLFIEVGATNVGSIHQTFTPHKTYQTGDEKGFFSFGGSALILLFPPNTITFDPLLVRNSQKHIETRCLMGEFLARHP